MNILYIHGFQSSGNSNTVKKIAQFLDDELHSPDIPSSPKEAILFLNDYMKNNQIDIVIGTSLGGLYAMQLNKPKIIINPALKFSKLPGKYLYLNKRENNETEFYFDSDDIQYVMDMINPHTYDPEYIGLSYVIIGKYDELINFNEIDLDYYFTYYDSIQYVDMGHRLSEEVIENVLIKTIAKVKKNIETIKNI